MTSRTITKKARAGQGLRRLILLCTASMLLTGLAHTASAAAAQPWWRLEAASRPAYIDPGSREAAQPQTQKIVMHLEGGVGVLELGVGVELKGFCEGESIGCFLYPEEFANEAEFPVASAATLQEALEGPYGAGEVTVTEQVDPLDETVTFEVTTPPGPPVVVEAGFEIGSPSAEVLDPGQAARPDGELYMIAENVGDAPLSGESMPVQLTASLPAGLEATAIAGSQPDIPGGEVVPPLDCDIATLSCSFEGTLPAYAALEIRLGVNVTPGAHSGSVSGFSASGGEASPASASVPIAISSEPIPFAVSEFRTGFEEEGGAVASGAGSHPFQMTTTVAINQGRDREPVESEIFKPSVEPAALVKDVYTKFPPGFIGNPTRIPTCSLAQFLSKQPADSGNPEGNNCPAQSALGIASVTLYEPIFLGYATLTVPLFNLERYAGEPARLGFYIPVGTVPALLDTSLRFGKGEGAVPGRSEDYGVNVNATNISQTAGLLAARVTVWGTPGDPRHDAYRGWSCMFESLGAEHAPCAHPEEAHPPAFLTAPTSCTAPMQASVDADFWAEPDKLSNYLPSEPLPTLTACNQLPFDPTIHAEPTSDATSSPTGLNFGIDIKNEGLTNGDGLAASEIKKAVVTLPQGFTTNPSIAEGLEACSTAEFKATTLAPGTGCREESKVGLAEIESPVVDQTVKGSLFVAKQHDNPYDNLLTLYLVFKSQSLGVLVKQALQLSADPGTGQLKTEVDEIPQLPFSHFRLSFRTGQRAPLVTPPACGTYAVEALLYPYSEPGSPVETKSSFQITHGAEGLPCPTGGMPPFHPNLIAGSENPIAGAFSPFDTEIIRRDSEQEITHFSIKLPPGVAGILAGIPECSDAAIAAAKAREHEGGGTLEEASPSCPAASEVGRSLVGSGVGNVLAYAPGKIYLAGAYHGSSLSLVSITSAKVGPFDLGTVVVRFALRIDPETAEVFVDSQGSDPIPHIVDGIPIHLRDIRAYVDRPNFTFNPTGCDPTSTASTVLGSGLDFVSAADDVPVTVSSRFQAADCAALPFTPKLKLSLKGSMKRTGAPAFRAELTMKPGEANIGRSVVTLPSSEFLFNAHIQDACGIGQFRKTGSCPASSVYGRVMAKTPIFDEPLEGPIYLMSGLGHKLPDLYAVLKNSQVEIHLDGIVSSLQRKKHGEATSLIRNTFATVPDAPVSKFVLEMDGGRKGLLQNSVNLCKGTNRAISEFTAHSGKVYDTKPVVVAKSCKGKKGSKRRRGRG